MNQRAKKVRPAHAVDQPLLRVSPRDLDTLLSTLDVRFVALSECLVSAGFRLEMGGIDAPGIHYNIAGMGRIFIRDDPPIDLWPHTLIVVPANCQSAMGYVEPAHASAINTSAKLHGRPGHAADDDPRGVAEPLPDPARPSWSMRQDRVQIEPAGATAGKSFSGSNTLLKEFVREYMATSATISTTFASV